MAVMGISTTGTKSQRSQRKADCWKKRQFTKSRSHVGNAKRQTPLVDLERPCYLTRRARHAVPVSDLPALARPSPLPSRERKLVAIGRVKQSVTHQITLFREFYFLFPL